MSRRLRIAPRATEDLLAAEQRFYAYQGATVEAVERHLNLIDAVDDLEFTPATWPKSHAFRGVRERLASGCKIFYEVRPDTGDNATAGDVDVLHIRLPSQDEPQHL